LTYLVAISLRLGWFTLCVDLVLEYNFFFYLFYREGFSDLEIETFFAIYEVKVADDVTAEETREIQENLELRKFNFDPLYLNQENALALEDKFNRFVK